MKDEKSHTAPRVWTVEDLPELKRLSAERETAEAADAAEREALEAQYPLAFKREAWRKVKASQQGRLVWPLDQVKDWTVRTLVDVGADLRKMNMAAASGRPRTMRGAVHGRYYLASPKEAEALKFESDLAWAVDQVQGEIDALASAVEVSHKGNHFPLTRASDETVSAAVVLFARRPDNRHHLAGKEQGDGDRAAAVLTLWQELKLADGMDGPTDDQIIAVGLTAKRKAQKEGKPGPVCQRLADEAEDEMRSNAAKSALSSRNAAAAFIASRVPTKANWRRDTEAFLGAFRARLPAETIASLEDVLRAAKRATSGRGRKPSRASAAQWASEDEARYGHAARDPRWRLAAELWFASGRYPDLLGMVQGLHQHEWIHVWKLWGEPRSLEAMPLLNWRDDVAMMDPVDVFAAYDRFVGRAWSAPPVSD